MLQETEIIAASKNPIAHPRAIIAATILGSSTAFIDSSVVNVALPAIATDLHAGAVSLPWTINAYLLPLGAMTLVGGAAGDRFGRRRLFLVGLLVFTLASVGCAAAPTINWLIAALQGLGAAILMPNSLAILGAAFSGEERGLAIGTWAGFGALAGAAAPLMGGLIVDVVGWRTVFLVNAPIAAVAAYLAWRYVARDGGEQKIQPDWAGAALTIASLALLTWALSTASSDGASRATWIAGFAGAATLAGFLLLESRLGDRAILPLSIFSSRAFVGLTIVTLLLYASLGGLVVLLPFTLIHVGGYSAAEAGAAMVPLPIVIAVGSRYMGPVAARYGGRLPLCLGSALVAVGIALYGNLGVGPIPYWTQVLPATFLAAAGMGICVAPLTTTVMASVDEGHVGTASGFNSAVARIGGALATALLGSVFALQGSATAFIIGVHHAAMVGAGAAGIAAMAALLLD